MNCKLFAALMLIAAFLIPQLVKAQPVFESGISDSTLFDTVTNLPADQTSLTGYISPPFPNFRQVNLQAGGSIGDVSSATDAVEINVNGGIIGNDFAVLFGVEVNLVSGSIGDNFISLVSEVNISGGSIGSNFQAFASQVNIFGSEFLLDDVPLTSLIPDQAFTVDLSANSTLSATLLDGSPFNIDLSAVDGGNSIVTVTQAVPEPASIIPLIATIGGFVARRRRSAVGWSC